MSASQTMTTTSCSSLSEPDSCREDAAALSLKFIAIASILVAGVLGIAIPLVGRHRTNFLHAEGTLFVAAKAFAGVILATGFVHMLSDGTDVLSDPSLPEYPWSKFPFSGLFAMVASLLTLLVDFVGTQYYERRQFVEEKDREKPNGGRVFGEEKGVGTRAHATDHSHNHTQVDGACDGPVAVAISHDNQGHAHGNDHGSGDGDKESGVRHVVSQILELGIVSHSVVIGLSLGVSQSPCTIRPLIAALSFHQFFEGFAVGACISQAQFKTRSTAIMACFFAITAPAGIGIGTAIASSYNPGSPGALIAEGILDSLSAGILVCMALVDLIAADFLSKRMSCNFRLQVVSYCSLFLGAGLMSALAIWA